MDRRGYFPYLTTKLSSSGFVDRRIGVTRRYGADQLIDIKAKTSLFSLTSIVLAAVLLQGCSTWSSLQPDQSAWQGHTIDELTESWGQADRTEQLGVDYVAYTWVKPGTSCEQTFLVSEKRITGYSSNGCDD